jgi:hypothetical protein
VFAWLSEKQFSAFSGYHLLLELSRASNPSAGAVFDGRSESHSGVVRFVLVIEISTSL